MFEFLLKYPASTWRYAEFVWSSGWPLVALLVGVLLALLAVTVTLLRQQLSAPRKIALGSLQFLTLSIGLAMIWQPALRIDIMQQGENTVAYLLDTSKSMLREDSGDQSRLQDASTLLNDDSLINSELFDASVYSLSDSLSSLTLPLPDNTSLINAASERTAIADGLQSVLATVNDQALAAVVLMSDGSDNASELSSDWWQSIKAAGVPVHTIGFGLENVAKDVELSDVFMDGQAGENTIVTARVRITHSDYSAVRLRIEAGDQLLYADDLALDSTKNTTTHSVTFNSGEVGVRDIKFSLSVKGGESNLVNNEQQRILNVVNSPKRVLYVEGEPRWEYKFIRRALHNNANVEIVSLLRTSANKFFRQGVRSKDELADGFPKTREALFKYSAVIIGSLEAAELSTEQQANLRDFVSERGGSLLMLAGQHGLSDGGWGRSALAAALPAKLASRTNVREFERIRRSVLPTVQGFRTPWLQLADNENDNAAAWSQLPEVNDVQPVGEVKPGSTVLLVTRSGTREEPMLVWHRYGQGQSYLLGTSGTWRWQMGLPSDNNWHELFWQQFLSHLAVGSLPQLSIDNTVEVYRDVEEIPIVVSARGADFKPLETGELVVNVTTPSGQQVSTVLNADINKSGRFIGSVQATEVGPYAIAVNAPLIGEAQVGTSDVSVQRWVVKERGTAEQFNTGLNKEFLQRVSAITGGRYLDASNKGDLAEVLSSQNAGITREETLPLWNMPLLFLVLLFAKLLEWFLRLRWKRL